MVVLKKNEPPKRLGFIVLAFWQKPCSEHLSSGTKGADTQIKSAASLVSVMQRKLVETTDYEKDQKMVFKIKA